MNERLAAALEAGGSSPETVRGVVHVIEQADTAEVVASLNGDGSTPRGEALPPAVSALEAEPPDAPSFDINGVLLTCEIHLLGGEGGSGKTTVSLTVAGSKAGGYDLFDCPAFNVNAPGPVLFISEEDSLGCLVNRLEAIVKGHGWDRERVLGNVYFIAQEGASLDDPTWRAHILAEACRVDASLVVFDPYTELTMVEENSNTEAKPNIKFFREINRAGASVLINAHTRKSNENQTTRDRIRGATALYDAARVVFILQPMDVGIAVECIKMNRSEKPRKFVVKREIESDPENRALWETARLTHVSMTKAEDEEAELFVLDQLTRRGTLNTTELKALAKGTGVNGVGVSGAIKNLSAIGRIGYEKGPRNSHMWHILPVAQDSRQPRQPDLPGCPEVARQPEQAALEVALPIGEATKASTGEQVGNPTELPWDDDSLLYELDEREGMRAEA